jgi:mannitol/fructose-specific phosphotransferase system IIA component (Ntr-type)
MKNIIDRLLELQELQYALVEEGELGLTNRRDELESSIRKLTSELPPEVARPYAALQKRYQAAIVAEIDGRCSSCSVSLATSLQSQIRSAKQLLQCPSCGRFLYHAAGAARRRPSSAQTMAGQMPGVARFSSPELMVPRLEAEDGEACIAALAHLMAERGVVDNADSLIASALRREALAPTALGQGLAFPHVRGVEGGGLTFALGLKPEGLKFDPQASELTRIVFFIICPSSASTLYLKLIAGLIETFRDPAGSGELLACETPARMWSVLASRTKRKISWEPGSQV